MTLRTLDNEIDFLAIVQKAQPLGEGRYAATLKGQKYTVTFKNDVLASISYTDGFDNNVVILFNDQKQNKPIEPSRFKPLVPADYDILKG